MRNFVENILFVIIFALVGLVFVLSVLIPFCCLIQSA